MSEKIVKFNVTPRVKKAFNVILIVSIILGIGSLIGAIVATNYRPTLNTETYYLDYGEEEAIIIAAEESQLLYFAVETDDDADVILIDYADYQDGGGFYVLVELDSNNGHEYTYDIPETGSYVIWVKNYDPYDFSYGKISYVLYNSLNTLELVLYLGTILFPALGMITAMIVAMISDARLKKT